LSANGEPTLLVTTRGFRDVLRIAYQNRPRLFDRHIVLPEMLYSEVIEADERMGAHGEVVQVLDQTALRLRLSAAYDKGLRSLAIVFLHGYRYSEHEQQAAALAQDIGFTQISTSHQTSPLMKMVSRGDTTVVDAYLSPILRRYVDQLALAIAWGTVAVHAVFWWLGRRPSLSRQGRDSVWSRWRHCRHGQNR
jgi:5-oxoprolinase (ATP-hydrolysing)